ncbi:MAG: glycosyltransferase family 4 protein [Acidobacteriota bacterium]|nr:glycosyltransferase family 4 protein [Acidobacteriota bacterium]
MRILNLVAGKKWTGTAAVVFDQTAALVDAGVEAQFGFVGDGALERRLMSLGWARPILRPTRVVLDYARDARRLAEALRRERFDLVHAHATHDHHVAAWAVRGTQTKMVRTLHTLRHVRRDRVTRALYGRTRSFAFANSAIAAAFGASGPVHSPVVDVSRFHPAASPAAPRAALGLPRERTLVGTVGKMAAGRGHRDAILAGAAVAGVSSSTSGTASCSRCFARSRRRRGQPRGITGSDTRRRGSPISTAPGTFSCFPHPGPTRASGRFSKRSPPGFRSWPWTFPVFVISWRTAGRRSSYRDARACGRRWKSSRGIRTSAVRWERAAGSVRSLSRRKSSRESGGVLRTRDENERLRAQTDTSVGRCSAPSSSFSTSAGCVGGLTFEYAARMRPSGPIR